MFRNLVIGAVGFVIGAVITYLVVVIGTTLAWEILDVHDQDGGGAMTLGLVIGPFVALMGGLISAFMLPIWAARRRGKQPPSTDAYKARDKQRLFITGGAIAGGIAGHYVAQVGFWFIGSISFYSFWAIRVITWIPTLVTLLGTFAGGWAVQRAMYPDLAREDRAFYMKIALGILALAILIRILVG